METTEEPVPAASKRVDDLIDGFWAVQVMNAAASLGIPDALAEGPATAETLAERAGANAGNLARLLRSLEGFGLVRSAEGGGYGLTPSRQLLREGVAGTREVRAVIRSDLTMMTVGGKERTASEYRALLHDAGLEVAAIRPSGARFSVIEAVAS